jgi:hypothetical protein
VCGSRAHHSFRKGFRSRLEKPETIYGAFREGDAIGTSVKIAGDVHEGGRTGARATDELRIAVRVRALLPASLRGVLVAAHGTCKD